MRQIKKRKLRLRFGLRFLLVFMAIVSFICYRYKQRTNFQYFANEIEKRGGAVFLRCQDPEIHNKYVVLSMDSGYYTVMLPDGSTKRKTHLAPIMSPGPPVYAVNINEFSVNDNHSKFRIIDFLSGSHSDVNFGAISIPASSADQDMIRLLSRIGGLEKILIMAHCSFFRAERIRKRDKEREKFPFLDVRFGWSTNSRHNNQEVEHATITKEALQATELIRVNFPESTIYSRGLEGGGLLMGSIDKDFCPKCLYRSRNGNFARCHRCGYGYSQHNN